MPLLILIKLWLTHAQGPAIHTCSLGQAAPFGLAHQGAEPAETWEGEALKSELGVGGATVLGRTTSPHIVGWPGPPQTSSVRI